MIIQIQELFTNMNIVSTYTIVICQNRTYCKPYRKVSREWCASFIWRIMQNSPHEVFQYVVLGYNRLKKNRVTRGLPTSFQSFSLLKVKRDLDRVRNKIMLDKKETMFNESHSFLYILRFIDITFLMIINIKCSIILLMMFNYDAPYYH